MKVSTFTQRLFANPGVLRVAVFNLFDSSLRGLRVFVVQNIWTHLPEKLWKIGENGKQIVRKSVYG